MDVAIVSKITSKACLLSVFIIATYGKSSSLADVKKSVTYQTPSVGKSVTYQSPSVERNVTSSSSDVAQRLSQAHFEFTLKLYRSLVQVGDPQSNMAFSPLLVSTLLTPSLLSAKEYSQVLSQTSNKVQTSLPPSAFSSQNQNFTRDFGVQKLLRISLQIQQVLNCHDLSGAAVEAWHKATLASLQDNYYKKFLEAPRGLFLLQKRFLSQELERILRKWFGYSFKAMQQPLSFARIVTEINEWAENKTNKKIGNLVTGNILEDINSVYLLPASIESVWMHKFDPNNTFQKGLFYITPDIRFEIPMMINQVELPLGYSLALEARVLELPFQIRRASLFIILPDHLENSLTKLDSNFTSESIRSLLSTLRMEIVNLRLPKFYIDTTAPLVQALKALGMKDLFRNGRISSTEPKVDFFVDDFIHRVRLDIHEGSAEEVSQSWNSSPGKSFGTGNSSKTSSRVGKFSEKYFEVDHPFIFFLWDYIASTIICMGRVVDPRVVTSRGSHRSL